MGNWGLLLGVLWLLVGGSAMARTPLEQTLGRNESRIFSARWEVAAGLTLRAQRIEERLGRLGYVKHKGVPVGPGQYARVGDTLWVYRNAHRSHGFAHPATLFGLKVAGKTDVVVGGVRKGGESFSLEGRSPAWLEPEVLGESFSQNRAQRKPVVLTELPAHVVQPLLALEDSRFYRHFGVDPKGVLRALAANVKAKRTVQGGSTITQQLVKNRDLSGTQSMSRKVSEATRAMSLEGRYTKEDILQSYINSVYFGHVDGVGVYGYGAAARVFFDRSAEKLSLAESATLAAVVQGPNSLSPLRHPKAAKARRNKALERMKTLGWGDTAAIDNAIASPLTVRKRAVRLPKAQHLRAYLGQQAKANAPARLQRGRGLWVESTVDPLLQDRAESAVRAGLKELRRRYPKLAKLGLTASLVAVHGESGQILAYVGGDPAKGKESLDRASTAARQPGSLLKPFVMLEAVERCGDQTNLNPASRISDGAITVTGSKPWKPKNYDRKHHGSPLLHEALVHSYNIPFVRVAQHCGWEATAERVRQTGLPLSASPPPSFVLGALEATPLQIAEAYTTFSGKVGRRVVPHGFTRMEGHGGFSQGRPQRRSTRVSSMGDAWVVRQNLIQVVERGTGRSARMKGQLIAGKTGTSSNLRDAWFAAEVGGWVVVTWVGLDGGGRLGLTGAQGAAPLFKRFAKEALPLFSHHQRHPPDSLHREWVDPKTGWIGEEGRKNALPIYFKGRQNPGRKRFWKNNNAPVLQ